MKTTTPQVYGIQELYRAADAPAEIEYVGVFLVSMNRLRITLIFLKSLGSLWHFESWVESPADLYIQKIIGYMCLISLGPGK